MTVLDNLLLGAHHNMRKVGASLQRVFEWFPILDSRKKQTARTLSGGERQMLAIGRALMSKPILLLLDEPSLGLQPQLVIRTFEAVKEINRRGVAILLVEQSVQFALEISHRAYVLESGKIVSEGKAGELLRSEHIKKSYLAI
jgi:branched-chain amino acid transport system ATP-binding protein